MRVRTWLWFFYIMACFPFGAKPYISTSVALPSLRNHIMMLKIRVKTIFLKKNEKKTCTSISCPHWYCHFVPGRYNMVGTVDLRWWTTPELGIKTINSKHLIGRLLCYRPIRSHVRNLFCQPSRSHIKNQLHHQLWYLMYCTRPNLHVYHKTKVSLKTTV